MGLIPPPYLPDWSVQVGALPAEVGHAEDRGADGEPDGEGAVVDELDDVAGAEVEEAEPRDHEHGRHRRHARHLDAGEQPRHLTLPRAREEEARGGEDVT